MARNKSTVVIILLLLSLFRVDTTFAQHQVINAAPVKPVINNFTPATTGQSASVTINGASFTGTTSVSFGGAPAAAFVVISDNTIVATVGSGASGSISLTNSGGTAAATGFTFVSAPAISYQTPQIYNVNTAIAPLSPQNTGGPVPASAYGRVTTFADGASTSFYLPEGIATDAAGNLYIGDSGNASVRKITPAGQVSTFAGGTRGYRDGTGTAAQFGNTFGLAFDKDGNLYVCDELVGYIRKITPAGVVTTLAGNGQMGFANGKGTAASFNVITGVAVDHSGNVFVADQFNNMIRKITPDGTVTTFAGSGSADFADGTGTSASFNNPIGIAIDAYDNLYVGDQHNNRIRKISPSGVVGTMAGNGFASFANGTAGAASFNQPDGIAVDAYGNLYIADALNNRIRKITPTGEVGTIAGNGQANSISGTGSSASFNNPVGVSLNDAGNAFITEFDGNIVSKLELNGYAIDKQLPPGLTFDPTTGKITGTPTAASPSTDYTITAYNLGGGNTTKVNITVIDNSVPLLPAPPKISYQTPQVYTINKAITALAPKNIGGPVPANAYGQVSTFAGANNSPGYNDGTGKNAGFSNCWGIDKDEQGNLYVSDNNKIRKITPAADVTTLAGGNPDGMSDGRGSSAGFNDVAGLAIAPDGNIYVGDFYNYSLRKITPSGVVSTFAGGPVSGFNASGVVTDKSGDIFIADQPGSAVRKIIPDGTVSVYAGTLGMSGFANGSSSSAKFDNPIDLKFDSFGNLFIADAGNSVIREISTAGVVTTFAGNTFGFKDGVGTAALFNQPGAIAFDDANNMYVADTHNFLIRKIDPQGLVTTIAGNFTQKSVDGIGRQASFDYVSGLVVKGGNLFVSDKTSIRQISLTGYTIDKPLPAGLTFDPTTGTISGTPTAISPATDYTITAYNTGGSSSTVVNITVKDANTALPPDISYQTPDVYTVRVAIAPLVPINKGGPATGGFGAAQVTTYAGTGVAGGTNGTTTTATFYAPTSVMTDATGNLYVSDATEQIRKITPGGVISTVAGNNVNAGYADGQGAVVRFNGPFQMAMDAAGNIYVTDINNNSIRKITPAGVVSRFAGTRAAGSNDGPALSATFSQPWGMVIDAAGNLYVADYTGQVIRKITPAGVVTTFAGKGGVPGSTDGIGTAARFNGPQYMAIDAAGNIYVSEYTNNDIRKITPAGVVTTIAGGPVRGFQNGPGNQAKFGYVLGLTVDSFGNIYATDAGNSMIRMITPAGVVSTFAGNGSPGASNGLPLSATFNAPFDITIDAAGNLYIADTGNNLIRKISQNGYTIDKDLPAGLHFDAATGIISGTPTEPSVSTNYTVTAHNAAGNSSTVVNITVTGIVSPVIQPPDISYQTPQKYTVNTHIASLAPTNNGGAIPGTSYGQVTTFAGSGQSGNVNGTGTAASFAGPAGLVFDTAGNLYVSEYGNSDIRKISPAGDVTSFSGNGNRGFDNGPGSIATFSAPYDEAKDANGNIYIGDEGNNVIRKITPGGLATTFAGTGVKGNTNGAALASSFNSPLGVVVDAAGNVYVADIENGVIRKINVSGQVTNFAVLDKGIGYLGIDAAGNIYAPDNNQVKKITPAGVITVLAGSGNAGFANGTGTAASFNRINDVAVDPAGNVYVSDADNNMVRKITPSGVVTTLAGSGERSAKNGPGETATFFAPYGLALDGAGNVYVADAGNHFIRKIALTGYSIDKPLPPGLTFDKATGVISGTPTAPSPATDYTVTGYNAGGSSNTVVNIEVIDNTVLPAPPKISYQTPQVYTVKTPITPLPPTNTGGAVPATTYGQVITIAGVADVSGSTNGAALSSTFKEPFGIVRDKAGNIYVADQGNNIIRKITPAGVVSTFAGTGAPGSANGAGTAASFYNPSALAIDASGNIYVADSGNNLLRKIIPAGVVSTLAGGGLDTFSDGQGTNANFFGITGLGIDAGGNLFAAETIDQLIRKITPGGLVSTYAGKNGTAGFRNDVLSVATFSQPSGVVVDGDENIYIADYNNNAIRKITPDGMVSTLAGGAFGSADGTGTQAKFAGPISVGADALGNIYVADQGNNIIRKITSAGVVTTIAGREGTYGAADGIGIAATLNFPTGIFVDTQAGDVYFTDAGSHLVRKIVTNGYTIDKPFPPGLTFDPTTGTISGTPTAPSPATDYTVTAYNTGGSSSTVVNITVLDIKSVTFGPLPPKTVCDADFDPGATGNSAITYTSDNPAVATIVNNKIHITGAGTSVITATDGTSTVTQPLTVTASVTPTINIVLGTVDCISLPLTYEADITDGGSNPVYQWQVNGQNAGENNHTFTSSDLKNGDKITCILTSNATCTTQATVTSNEVTVTLPDPVVSSITITSSETAPVCAGTPITFTATSVNPGDKPHYEWQVNGVDKGGDNSTFTSSNLNDGDIVTCILHASVTCQVDQQTGSNSITITLNPVSQCIIVIPNTFTPNGDGINDLWNITALTYHPDCLVRVFNRYGQQVFESKGYNKPWDGTSNNSTLPTGTYYYIIDLKNGARPLGGYVAIVH